ncbi:MAG: hypothetical protein AB8F95_15515 [Bacteroidia bacterium]
MLENLVYSITILLLMGHLVIARQKVFPLVVISHAVLQYLYTLLSWKLNLAPGVGLATLGFILATTVLLMWGRKMQAGTNEHRMARVMINTLQWSFLGALVLFIIMRSPDWYEFSGTTHPEIAGTYVSLHPFIRMAGNYFLFALFVQVVLRWGLVWERKDTLANLAPFIGYVLLVLLLLLRQSTFHHHPYT